MVAQPSEEQIITGHMGSERTRILASVPQRMQRSRNASAASDKLLGRIRVDGLDRRETEQTAEFDRVAGLLPHGGDDAYGCRLVVDHADGGFIRNDGRNR